MLLLTNEPFPGLLFASDRIEEISGFGPDEIRADPGLWTSRLHPEEVDDLQAGWTSAIEHDDRFAAEHRFLHLDGTWRWFRVRSSPVRGSDGAVRYRQSFIEDITPERSAEAQAQRSKPGTETSSSGCR